MKRPTLLLLAFTLAYIALLGVFAAARSGAGGGIVQAVWTVSGALVLSSTALEVTLLAFWLHHVLRGTLRDEPFVPLELSDGERQDLQTRAPPVAMLMPAHCEVTTPEDAEAFAARAADLICRTPRYASLFLLFDSPVEQHDNELAVVEDIRRRLRRRGRSADTERLRMETYREKPAGLRNKPGSLQLWLERHAPRFDYLFVLDADSSLAEEDPSRPETRDVLARLVLAMERHAELAMIQTRIALYTAPTLWGWTQNVGCRMASRYHGRLFQWLLEGTVPSYGHNVLFRVDDFVRHVKNTLDYLSHDFLDAADLATAGRKCIHTHAAVTREEVEASLAGYVKRDLRWARGNAQWANYWLTKRGLPLGPRIFLAIGILSYVWPLLANIFFVTSVLLVGQGVPLFDRANPAALDFLLGAVVAALVLPRVIAARSLAELNGSVIIGWLISGALTALQGVLFLLGAFGTKWTMRGSRSQRLDVDHAVGILRLFLPLSLLGLALWQCILGDLETLSFGAIILRVHLALLVASPALALVLSCPLPAGIEQILAREPVEPQRTLLPADSGTRRERQALDPEDARRSATLAGPIGSTPAS